MLPGIGVRVNGATRWIGAGSLQFQPSELSKVLVVEQVYDHQGNIGNGTVPLLDIESLSDDEVVARLVQVRGIGRWTAEMFLIFHLGRPDVLSTGDLGIRRAAQIRHIGRLRYLGELLLKRAALDLAAAVLELTSRWRDAPHPTDASTG